MRRLSRALRVLQRDTPFLITIANLGAMGLALVTAPIVARALGPDGRGETAAVLAVQAVVPILLAAGVPLELRRLTATEPGDSAIRAARDIWLVALVPSALAAMLLDATIFSAFDADARLIAFVGVAVAPLTMSWSSDVSVLVARGKYRAVMGIRLIQPVLFLLVTTTLWLLDALTVTLVIGINILATLITCIVGLSLVRTTAFGKRFSHMRLLTSGLKYYGSSLAETASNRLDQILVLPLVGAFGAGLYAVAVTIGTLPLALGQALGAPLFREVATATTPEERAKAISGGVRGIAALSAVACLSLAAVSPLVIPFLFGEEFAGSVPLTLILLIGSFALSVGYVCSMMLAAQGQGIRMTIAQTVSLAISIGLLYALAPTLGAMGASIASTAGYIALLLILIPSLRISFLHLLPSPSGFRYSMRTLLG